MTTALILIGYFVIWVVTAVIIRKITYDEIDWSSGDAVLFGFIWPLIIHIIAVMIPIVLATFIVELVSGENNYKSLTKTQE